MLGTFPYELWFKSYRCFTVGSLEFLEIANLSLFPSPPPCSASRRRRHLQRRRRPPPPPVASRWSLPAEPRAPPLPEPPRRPPPRHRRGQPRAELAALS